MAQPDYCDTLLYVHKTTNLGDATITERYFTWPAHRREQLSDRGEQVSDGGEQVSDGGE